MVNTSEVKARFQRTFPDSMPRVLVRAPGRVNLIGEHTDYNEGFVLPIAMSQSLYVAAGRSEGSDIAVHSTAFDETVTFAAEDPGEPGDPGPRGRPGWAEYVRGVAALLRRRGVGLQAARLLIHSEVPIGGGVSSSAALEVGAAVALLALASRRMEAVPLALLARQAEHEYAGSPCGIMDQFVCVLGRAGHGLLLDCRSQRYEQIPLPFDEASVVVLNTQVKHELGSSEYPVRQQQCREGLSVIQQRHPEAVALRDVSADMLNAHKDEMDAVVFRRCRHVVTEVARTEEAANALRAGELERFGQLMFESHASLRDDYAVSCPELDYLVEIAQGIPGVYGARMTGGGFGGCAIALIRRDAEATLRAAVARQYDARFDKPAIVYTTTASGGVSVEPVL